MRCGLQTSGVPGVIGWRCGAPLPQRRAVLRLALAGLPLWPAAASAWGEPAAALCGNGPAPAHPAPGQPPLLETWVAGQPTAGPAPDCQGLSMASPELLVRLTGSCQRHSTLADELQRFGQVSRLKGMPYWSFTDQKREPMIALAHAVTDAGGREARADFSLAELQGGGLLYFVHDDNRSRRAVVYRMRLLRHSDTGFVLYFDNLGELSFMGLTLLAPQELQWRVSVQALGAGVWGYQSLLALQRMRLGRASQHRLSNLSRTVAMFDLWAGRQTDVERYR